MSDRQWDFFVSHASEDKEEFVRPLADLLQDCALRVWYDEFTLSVGDSLRRSIDHGLSNSRYGIVVISSNFLTKEWPQKELDALLGREINDRKVILPVWHGVGSEAVRNYSPMLADRIALSSDAGIDVVAAQLFDAIALRPCLDLTGHWAGDTGSLVVKDDLMASIKESLAYMPLYYVSSSDSRTPPGRHRSTIRGTYDWGEFEGTGELLGHSFGSAIYFDWKWSKGQEHGNGFMIGYSSLEDEFDSLAGGWFLAEDKMDVDEIASRFAGRDVFLREDVDAMLDDLPHPWSFKRRKDTHERLTTIFDEP